MDVTLPQTATYWSPGGVDGTTGVYGARSFGAPVTIKCRWEDRTDFGVTTGGWQRDPKSVVYTKTEPKEGGYLYLGVSTETDPESVDGAALIMKPTGTPSLDNDDMLYMAVVG